MESLDTVGKALGSRSVSQSAQGPRITNGYIIDDGSAFGPDWDEKRWKQVPKFQGIEVRRLNSRLGEKV
jgi:hypothetical protein